MKLIMFVMAAMLLVGCRSSDSNYAAERRRFLSTPATSNTTNSPTACTTADGQYQYFA